MSAVMFKIMQSVGYRFHFSAFDKHLFDPISLPPCSLRVTISLMGTTVDIPMEALPMAET